MHIQNLIDTIFADFEKHYQNYNWVSERAILSLRNESVDEINEIILNKIPGTLKIYKSIDTTVDECEATIYPTEFLNSLNSSGIPQHNLKLKIGAMIMLMRNLNPPLQWNKINHKNYEKIYNLSSNNKRSRYSFKRN